MLEFFNQEQQLVLISYIMLQINYGLMSGWVVYPCLHLPLLTELITCEKAHSHYFRFFFFKSSFLLFLCLVWEKPYFFQASCKLVKQHRKKNCHTPTWTIISFFCDALSYTHIGKKEGENTKINWKLQRNMFCTNFKSKKRELQGIPQIPLVRDFRFLLFHFRNRSVGGGGVHIFGVVGWLKLQNLDK